MSEQHVRKTQARVAERQRRRAQADARKKLPWELGLGALAVLAIVAGLYLFLTGSGSSGSGAQGPRFQVDSTNDDLGDVPLGKTVHASFTVKNTGTGALTLDVPQMPSVLKGCWPPDIVVGQTTLGAGESTTISMDFMMHEGMDGPHLFEVPVKTNDPTNLLVKLQVASNWVKN